MQQLLFLTILIFAPAVFAVQAPDTAACVRENVCNGELCADVCVAGTVEIDSWAVDALNFQRRLQRDLPLPYYQMPGTHNSYQSQHSGIGVEEQGLHELFILANYEQNNVALQNQRYSVTDQLRMGLRWIELDMWGFVFQYEDIRLCHDPFPDPRLLYWVEKAQQETGVTLNWDPANLGCFSTRNQNLETGLQEINAWLTLPENEEEIIVIYYDAKTLFTPHQVDNAINTAVEIFGDKIFTRAEKELLGRWPSAQELITRRKQIILECNSEHFSQSRIVFYPTLSSKENGGNQFSVERFTPFPHCAIDDAAFNYGQGFFRPLDHSISKGPAMQVDPIKMITREDIRNFVNCGINTMALDNVQPSYIAEMIWSWAPGEPTANGCAYMNEEGRWQTHTDCALALKHACVHVDNRLDWTLSASTDSWNNPNCPDGYQFSFPRTGYENALLHQVKDTEEIWLAP